MIIEHGTPHNPQAIGHWGNIKCMTIEVPHK